MTSATNPENGTVTNYYNPDNQLWYKVDAKGQATVYCYDSYKRVTQVSKFPTGYVANLGSPCPGAPGSTQSAALERVSGGLRGRGFTKDGGGQTLPYGVSVTPANGTGQLNTALNLQLVWAAPAGQTMLVGEVVIQDSALGSGVPPTLTNACYLQVWSTGAARLADDSATFPGSYSYVGVSYATSPSNAHCQLNGPASSLVTMSGQNLQETFNVTFTAGSWNNKTLNIFLRAQNTSYQFGDWTQLGTLTLGSSQTFNLSANPASAGVGSQTSAAVAINRVNGFSAGVTLAVASGWPTGITASAFAPNPATGSSSTVTIYVASGVAVGTYQLPVTGSGGGVGPMTTNIQLTVTSGSSSEDYCQRVNYFYDGNPFNPYYSQYVAGRLGAIQYAGANCGTSTGNNYVEMYSYTQAGQVTNKALVLVRNGGSVQGTLEAVYSYDTEGKLLTTKYPLGTTYSFTYDNMGRPTKMTDTQASQDLVSTVTYGPAGELLSMSGTAVSETRTYNAMGQLTQLTGINVNLKYTYSTSSNNGQIASQQDLISGETITYAYDTLKRLSSASSTQGWGQGFSYDGFGNLTSKYALSGAPPVGTYTVDASTNRLSGISYDSNGNQLYSNVSGNAMNLSYDVANRLTIASGYSTQASYEYDASNKRVYQLKQFYNGSTWQTTGVPEWYFYGIDGKKLGTYTFNGSSWSVLTTQVFFRGKLIVKAGASAQEDIRGSVGNYYPYGEDRGAATQDTVGFGTYTRDSVTGLDYAVNRYHVAGSGRFASADPYGDNWDSSDPSSWNMYSYVGGDPTNYLDPSGLVTCGNTTLANAGSATGQTISAFFASQTDFELIAASIFTESAGAYTDVGATEMGWIASVISNRWLILNGYDWLYYPSGNNNIIRVSPDWGPEYSTVSQLLFAPGPQFEVWSSPGVLNPQAQARLGAAIGSDALSSSCGALAIAIADAQIALNDIGPGGNHQLFTANGLVLTSFNSNINSVAPGKGWEQRIGTSGSSNVFYGIDPSLVHAVPYMNVAPNPRITRPRPVTPKRPIVSPRQPVGQ